MAFVESSTKARWLLLNDLQKQDGFFWKLYESKMAFVESSTKVGWLSLKALRKQDGFRWKLYESPIAFIESSSNAGWLSLKALWKPLKKCVNRDITKFRDKIAYVGGPSFRRRPWPFGERCSRNICHPEYTFHFWANFWKLMEMKELLLFFILNVNKFLPFKILYLCLYLPGVPAFVFHKMHKKYLHPATERYFHAFVFIFVKRYSMGICCCPPSSRPATDVNLHLWTLPAVKAPTNPNPPPNPHITSIIRPQLLHCMYTRSKFYWIFSWLNAQFNLSSSNYFVFVMYQQSIWTPFHLGLVLPSISPGWVHLFRPNFFTSAITSSPHSLSTFQIPSHKSKAVSVFP